MKTKADLSVSLYNDVRIAGVRSTEQSIRHLLILMSYNVDIYKKWALVRSFFVWLKDDFN